MSYGCDFPNLGGTAEYKAVGGRALELAAAFSAQMFFIPILKKNPNSKNYTFYTQLWYILLKFVLIFTLLKLDQ